MIKKIISIFMASILLVSCFAGCEKEEKDTYFACAIDEMPRYFDPQIVSNKGEKIVAVNIFDGLFKLDENGKPQKCVVKDYKVSGDGLVYTFHLKENLKYYISDEVKSFLEEQKKDVEAKVTAKDFVFGITRAVLPETNAPDFELLSIIKNATKIRNGKADKEDLGVRAVDDYTLEITLEKKNKEFLYALSQPVSFPCDEEFFEATKGRYGLDEQYIISNGGFYISDVKDEESVRFSKNEEYTGDFAPIPTSVRLRVNTDVVDIAKKVNDEDYDLGFFSDTVSIDKLGRKTSKTEYENITVALVFNMQNKYLQSVKLRTGLICGIDLSLVTENPVKNLVASYYDLSGGEVEALSYNKEKARENMISAFKDFEIDKLTVNILCTEEYEKTAKAIVNSWQADIGVGLNGTITVAEESEFDQSINSGDFNLAIYPLTVDSNKSVDFLSIFTTNSGENVSRYSSNEYDRIIEKLRAENTEENAVYGESYLLKNAVVLPVQYQTTVFAMAKGVSGIYCAGDSSNIYFYKGQK